MKIFNCFTINLAPSFCPKNLCLVPPKKRVCGNHCPIHRNYVFSQNHSPMLVRHKAYCVHIRYIIYFPQHLISWFIRRKLAYPKKYRRLYRLIGQRQFEREREKYKYRYSCIDIHTRPDQGYYVFEREYKYTYA